MLYQDAVVHGGALSFMVKSKMIGANIEKRVRCKKGKTKQNTPMKACYHAFGESWGFFY